MSIRQSLLAILDQGSCYGYQLRTEFDRRTGGTWPLNVGQIYQTLDRLERDGLVGRGESDRDGRAYYEITDAGSRAAADWLASPVDRRASARDELAIKLAVAATLPGVDTVHAIRVQRQSTLSLLHEVTAARDSAGQPETAEDLARLLIVDAQVFRLESELRWLDQVQDRIARAGSEARSLPLSTEVPKRGRPARQQAEAVSAPPVG